MFELLNGDRVPIDQVLVPIKVLGCQIKVVRSLSDGRFLFNFLLIELTNLPNRLAELRFCLLQRDIRIVLVQANQDLPALHQLSIIHIDCGYDPAHLWRDLDLVAVDVSIVGADTESSKEEPITKIDQANPNKQND